MLAPTLRKLRDVLVNLCGIRVKLRALLIPLSSLGIVIMPFIGASILGEVSHFAATDWRIGTTFFVSAVMQTIALIFAYRHFNTLREPSKV
jgi:DHA1 family tetracycline resistance protein-like MFS transporter